MCLTDTAPPKRTSAGPPHHLANDPRSRRIRPPSTATASDNDQVARLLCHGAMYQVKWDAASKKPVRVLAEEYSNDLHNKPSVAVGATLLDALLASIHAHTPRCR